MNLVFRLKNQSRNQVFHEKPSLSKFEKPGLSNFEKLSLSNSKNLVFRLIYLVFVINLGFSIEKPGLSAKTRFIDQVRHCACHRHYLK